MKKTITITLAFLFILSVMTACVKKAGDNGIDSVPSVSALASDDSGESSYAGENTTAQAEASVSAYVPDSKAPESAGAAEGVYVIADYYKADGSFSALGLALPFDPQNGERMLRVKDGDIISAGGAEYKVTAEELELYFHTQPSLDEVILWWTDYMDSFVSGGQAAEGNL